MSIKVGNKFDGFRVVKVNGNHRVKRWLTRNFRKISGREAKLRQQDAIAFDAILRHDDAAYWAARPY